MILKYILQYYQYMNVFMPFNNVLDSIKVLDNKRLGKQRVEGMQLINSYHSDKKGWKNHPIRIMWLPFEKALKYYVNCCIEEWCKRGFNNTMKYYDDYSTEMPWWFSWNQLNYSHQSSLLNKDYDFYIKFFDVNLLIYNNHINYGYIWINHLNEDQLQKAKNNIWISPSEICFKLNK